MKLSVRIDAPEDSAGAEDGNSTSPNYPSTKHYSTEKIAGVLEGYLLELCPASKNYDYAEVSMTFMNPDEIRSLNREYRDIDEPTDVLSFPMFEPDAIPSDLPVLMLGDIVICPEEVSKLHPELSQREGLSLMIAHSFLHLLGYDHDTDEKQAEMWEKQDEISRKLLGVLE